MTLNRPKINSQEYSKLELTPVQFSSQTVKFKMLSSWELLKIVINRQFWKGSDISNDPQSPQNYSVRILNVKANFRSMFKPSSTV